MKVGVKILPRNEVLDTQGRTVTKSLQQNGKNLSACRVGKYIELDVEAQKVDEALTQARDITEFILYNPLIESYQLEVLNDE